MNSFFLLLLFIICLFQAESGFALTASFYGREFAYSVCSEAYDELATEWSLHVGASPTEPPSSSASELIYLFIFIVLFFIETLIIPLLSLLVSQVFFSSAREVAARNKLFVCVFEQLVECGQCFPFRLLYIMLWMGNALKR
jgi:hypothetical protein